MAYKSKVTNKYFGSTYEGRPNVAKESPFSELASAINRNVDSFQAAGDNYIKGKKQDAIAEINELYASGKTSDEISALLLSGENETLSNFYAESAVQGQNGRFAAAEMVAKINQSVEAGEYDFVNDNLTNFHKKFLADYKLNSQDDSFILGFSAVYNEFKANAAIEDGKKKGEYHNNQLVQKSITLLETVPINEYDTKLIPMLESLSVEMPKLDGKGKKNFLVNGIQKKEILIGLANKKYLTATTDAELNAALKILEIDRGTGSGGNPLGALVDSDETAQALVANINAKKVALANQEYTNGQRAIEAEQKGYVQQISALWYGGTYTDANGQEVTVKANEAEAEVIINEALDKHPDLVASLVAIKSNNQALNYNETGIRDLKMRIMKGDFVGNYKGFLEAAATAGATSSDLSALETAFGWAEGRVTNNQYLDPFRDDNMWQESNQYLHGIIVQKAATFGQWDKGVPNDILFRDASYAYEQKVMEWYGDIDNKEPSQVANGGQDWRTWNSKRKEFMKNAEEEILKQFSSEDYFTAMKNIIASGDTDLIAAAVKGDAATELINKNVTDIVTNMDTKKFFDTAANMLIEPEQLLLQNPDFLSDVNDLNAMGVSISAEDLADMVIKNSGQEKIDLNERKQNIATNISTLLADGFEATFPQLLSENESGFVETINFFKDYGAERAKENTETVTNFLNSMFGELTGTGENFNPAVLNVLSAEQIDLIAVALGVDQDDFLDLLLKTYPNFRRE